MIASVQYNDLRGTVAADVSDAYMNSLQSYLKDRFKEYNHERYFCNGCTIWMSGYNKWVSISFVCFDKQEDKYVKFSPAEGVSIEEALNLFKRVEIVLGIDINEIEVSESDYLELK